MGAHAVRIHAQAQHHCANAVDGGDDNTVALASVVAGLARTVGSDADVTSEWPNADARFAWEGPGLVAIAAAMANGAAARMAPPDAAAAAIVATAASCSCICSFIA